jgi:hypothetical protein
VLDRPSIERLYGRRYLRDDPDSQHLARFIAAELPYMDYRETLCFYEHVAKRCTNDDLRWAAQDQPRH